MSTIAKKEKRLQKAGYTTRKGQFGAVRIMKGGGDKTLDDAIQRLIIDYFVYEHAKGLPNEKLKITEEEKKTLKELLTQIINKVHQRLKVKYQKDLTDSQIFDGIRSLIAMIPRVAIQKIGFDALIGESEALYILLEDRSINNFCNNYNELKRNPLTYNILIMEHEEYINY